MPTPTGKITYTHYLYYASPSEWSSNWSDTETLSNGSATSAPLPGGIPLLGTASVTASYSGDSTYGPESTVATFTVTAGTALPFSLSGSPLTIVAGATSGNTSTVTVTPQGGFTGNVYLSCALVSSPAGAIHLPTCNIPASVNITSTAAATAAMTIGSTAPSTVTTTASGAPGRNGRVWNAANGAFLLCGVVLLACCKSSRRRRLWISFGVLFVLGGFIACGGGNSGGGTQTQQIPGTTPGSYAFTVKGAFSANGASQTQVTVSVTIQ